MRGRVNPWPCPAPPKPSPRPLGLSVQRGRGTKSTDPVKIIAVAFVFVYVILAWLLVGLSVHGPDSLPWLAGVYLIAATSALLLTCRYLYNTDRKYQAVIAFLVGLGLACCAPLVVAASAAYEEIRRDLQLARTKVSDVTGETLYTESGNPIGIRVSYTIRFPWNDHYDVDPFLRPGDTFYRAVRDQIPRNFTHGPLHMKAIARTIVPFPEEANHGKMDPKSLQVPTYGLWFDRGVDYQFTFDMIPRYIGVKKDGGGYCRGLPEQLRWHGSPEGLDALIRGDAPTRYEIWIHDTTYGRLNGEETFTQNEYNPREFYDGLQRENGETCDPLDLKIY